MDFFSYCKGKGDCNMGRDIKQLHPRLQQKIAELKQMCSGEGTDSGNWRVLSLSG